LEIFFLHLCVKKVRELNTFEIHKPIFDTVYFTLSSGMGQPNDKFLTSILKVYEPMKVDNDSLRFIFDDYFRCIYGMD